MDDGDRPDQHDARNVFFGDLHEPRHDFVEAFGGPTREEQERPVNFGRVLIERALQHAAVREAHDLHFHVGLLSGAIVVIGSHVFGLFFGPGPAGLFFLGAMFAVSRVYRKRVLT